MDPVVVAPFVVSMALFAPAAVVPPVAATVATSRGPVASPASAADAAEADRRPSRSTGDRATSGEAGPSSRTAARVSRWISPVTPLRVARSFEAPAQNWLPGHRGVDLLAPPGTPVRAPADGRVAFVGMVAGRPVVSIDHDDPAGTGTLRTTYEPVVTRVSTGDLLTGGDVIGEVASDAGSHCTGGCLHWGARRGETYVDPLSFLRTGVRLWPPSGSAAQRPSRTG